MQMWVFGYGSLLWNPGFDYVEKRLARLIGYRRNFCMRSIYHRDTPAAPGLVLALDATSAAICDGLACVIDQTNDQYCQGLSLEEQARIIAIARGGRGDNSEYLFKTVEQMEKLSIQNADFQWLAQNVLARLAEKGRGAPLPLPIMDGPCFPIKVKYHA